MNRHATAWTLAALLLAAPFVHADPLGFATPPAEIAARVMNNAPGSIVVGVSRQGRAQFAMQRNGLVQPGPVQEIGADGQPIFEVGSISKLFTGVLLAQAVERGDLSLDDTVGRLLAGQVTLPPDIAAITLRRLVTHSACLPGMLPDAPPLSDGNPFARTDRAQLLTGLSTLKLDRKPPCSGPYSSLGLGLLGQLLADHYGKPWDMLVHENIAAPLGMKDTLQYLGPDAVRLAPGYDDKSPRTPWDFGALAGAGALRSTAADLLVFARALMAGRKGPLGAAAERALTPLGHDDKYELGYAIRMRGPVAHRTYFHTGQTGGYRALLVFDPSTQDAAVMVASNASAAAVRMVDDITVPPATARRRK
ncbi:serine hydrolase domain-containing protein [Variovorax sp. GB1P17]|uniref:serine hydrolase domain-containing protein n=1 Tax=Variovorax sp. GB1P17 TaxID=3443740 RepID=UPI003F455113